MRMFIAAVALTFVSALSSGAMAQGFAANEESDEFAAADSNEFESIGYNIWFCTAVKRTWFGAPHLYFGASSPFPQGSGLGQAAQAYARSQAAGQCGSNCVTECYVSRFSL